MIKYLKNTSGAVLRLPHIRKKLPVDFIWEIPMHKMDNVLTCPDTLAAIRSGNAQIGPSEVFFYTDPLESEAFLLTTFEGYSQVIEGGSITQHTPDIIIDALTGKKTTTVYNQICTLMREVFNNIDNPLYSAGYTTILEQISSILIDIADNTTDISTLQTIVSNLQSQIDTINIVITSIQTEVTSNTTDIADNNIDITNIQSIISTHTSDISLNSSDIILNTTNIANNQTDITTNISNILTNQTDISSNATSITTNSSDIAANIVAISANTTDIANNTSDILSNQTNIISLQTSDTSQTSDISTLQSSILSIQSQLASLDPYEEQGANRPNDLLIFYGYLNSFNSDVNSWDNEKVAQDMAKYNILVFGDGVADPTHPDYANSSVIIPRIKELNPSAKIFGYVTIFQDMSTFQTKTDQWDNLQINGIMLDEAGYDYGTTTTNSRSAFNTRVDYVHGQTYANICFANAWNMDHIIGTANDPSYPNATWNVSLEESNLTEDDWFLLESFAVNTLSYPSKFEAHADWKIRGDKAVSHRAFYDINLAAVAVIGNTHVDALDCFHFGFTSAMIYALDAFGSSDDYYGASSAKVVMWNRPDVCGLGKVWQLQPIVSADGTDAEAYIRFTDFGKLSVDFTVGVEESEILKN